MVPIEQKDWTEEDRASKLGQNHPLDSTKRRNLVELDVSVLLQQFSHEMAERDTGASLFNDTVVHPRLACAIGAHTGEHPSLVLTNR